MTPEQKLRAFRAIDKLDRVGPRGVYELLTVGRLDPSGDFMPGCGLLQEHADFVMVGIGYEFKNGRWKNY